MFLQERGNDLLELITLDAEAGALYVYCTGEEAPQLLRKFIAKFIAACEDEAVIRDLFSHAKID